MPDTILRFFPSPGNEVTLNGPRSLRSRGMVHTALPFKGGGGEEGGDEGEEGEEGEEGQGRGLAGGLAGRGVAEAFGSEVAREVTTTVSVIVSGGRDTETVTVDASWATVLVRVVVSVAVEVETRVTISVSVSVSSIVVVEVTSGIGVGSLVKGSWIGSRLGGAGRSIARTEGNIVGVLRPN